MGPLATPDGTCARDKAPQAGITCWVAVIPAQPADAASTTTQWWHRVHAGLAGLLRLVPPRPPVTIGSRRGTGQGFPPSTARAAQRAAPSASVGSSSPASTVTTGRTLSSLPQKAGPIPLGDECGAAGLSAGSPPPASCPEGGHRHQRRLHDPGLAGAGSALGTTNTELAQTYAGANAEIHQSVVYWVVGTGIVRQDRQIHTDQSGVRLGGARGPGDAGRGRGSRTGGTARRSCCSR